MQYNAIQCKATQWNTMHSHHPYTMYACVCVYVCMYVCMYGLDAICQCTYNTMQYNAMQCNTMQYNAVQCNTMQYTIQCNTMQYNAIQCNTMQYYAMQYNAIQCNAMQYRRKNDDHEEDHWEAFQGLLLATHVHTYIDAYIHTCKLTLWMANDRCVNQYMPLHHAKLNHATKCITMFRKVCIMVNSCDQQTWQAVHSRTKLIRQPTNKIRHVWEGTTARQCIAMELWIATDSRSESHSPTKKVGK
jgi:hypothetical protein